MAEAVVSIVLERLLHLLGSEAKFLHGVRGQVEDARDELQRLRCFLRDADSRARQGDEMFWNHVSEIKEAAYDLDDVVGTFALKNDSSQSSWKVTKHVLKRFPCILIDLRSVRSEIVRISAKLSKSRSSFQAYGVMQSQNWEGASFLSERERERRQAYSHVVERDIVGFEEDIKELVLHLTKEEDPYRVVSICGMGGLGKTTLARKIYHHCKVRNHFHCFAWVSISQQYNVKDVWEKILFALISASPLQREEITKKTKEDIAEQLYLVQQERKCLVILDDIWTIETWDCLKAAFPEDEANSKLLLTTRNKDLPLFVNRKCFLHEPKCLDDNKSWELFENKVNFGTADTDNEKMKELGRAMLKHCAGLPLAIIVLGGLLSTRQTVGEWEMVHKNVKRYIAKGKMDLHEKSEYSTVSWVLGLSYDELPYYLKPCFLYLARFQEDFEIKVGDLCRIWMAEGFTPSEDMAYECLFQLVQRCMVQVGEWGLTGRIKTFRIHDLMRDMCLLKAQEENFLRTIDFSNRAVDSMSSSTLRHLVPTYKDRRVAIILTDTISQDELLSSIRNIDGSLRSLICVDFDSGLPRCRVRENVDVIPLLKRFHALRVLKLENFDFNSEKFPEEIGNLIHLRFLSLQHSWVSQYPSSMSNLRQLQTLDLRTNNFSSLKMPNSLWKFNRLRHLYLPYSMRLSIGNKLLPDNIISNLQTLVNMPIEFRNMQDFMQLNTNFTKLAILVYDSNMTKFMSSTSILQSSLHSLVVKNRTNRLLENQEPLDVIPLISSCPWLYKLILVQKMVKLPKACQFSPNLIKLKLFDTYLKDDPMITLEKLPNLRVLELGGNSFTGSDMVCSKGGFPQLECLLLNRLPNFLVWRVEEGTLPKLSRLGIYYCIHLIVPQELRYITTLKVTEIKRD